MPKDIENGEIIFEEEKRSYADKGIYRDELMDKPYAVDVVSWKRNKFSADLYYKQLQVTYTMTVSRLGSYALKTVLLTGISKRCTSIPGFLSSKAAINPSESTGKMEKKPCFSPLL